FGVAVLAVREPLQRKFRLLFRKVDARPFGIYGGGVADLAHPAFFGGEVLLMALDAGGGCREQRRRAVVFTHMAEGAILSLGLMLLASVNKRRNSFNHL